MSSNQGTVAPVVVHLRTALPRYVVTGLERLVSQFPDGVVLITDVPCRYIPGVELVDPRDLGVGEAWPLPRGLARYDIRKDLWTTSFLRLVAVARYAQLRDAPVVHLESDVVVIWPEALNAWAELQPGVAFPLLGEGRGIASTLMIRDGNAASEFLDRIGLVADSLNNATEMDYLGRLQETWTSVIALPRAPGIWRMPEATRAIAVALQDGSSRSSHELELDDMANAVFDGAGLGISLCGVDPIHTRGLIRTRTGIHHDRYAPGGIIPHLDDSSGDIRLLVRNIEGDRELGRVVTLHCNSKEARLFRSDGLALRRRLSSTDERQRTVGVSAAAIRELMRLRVKGVARRLENGAKSIRPR